LHLTENQLDSLITPSFLSLSGPVSDTMEMKNQWGITLVYMWLRTPLTTFTLWGVAVTTLHPHLFLK